MNSIQSSSIPSLEKLILDCKTNPHPDWGLLEQAVYDRIKKTALQVTGHSDASVSFGATSLTHETFARLIERKHMSGINDVPHFFALMTVMMRQVYTDYHRRRNSWKNGGRDRTCSLDSMDIVVQGLESSSGVDYLNLQDCLEVLEERYPRQGQSLELRILMAMSISEISAAINVSRSTVEADLRFAKAFFRKHIVDNEDEVMP